jgi:type I restriction enzyme S subunit
MKVPVILDAEDHITRLAIAESSTNEVPKGSVLVVTRSGILAHSLPVALTGRNVTLNQDLKALIPGQQVDGEYVFRALQAFTNEILATCRKSGTTVASIETEKLLAFRVPVPPFEVQRRIVAKLDALLAQSRAAREQLEVVPALVEKYRQSVLAAAFRGDLTAEWRKKNSDVEPASVLLERIRAERRRRWEEAELAKMKAKGKAPKDDTWKAKYAAPAPVDLGELPELPSTWVWARVQEVGEVVTGFTPATKDPENFGGDVPFFKPTDLDQGDHLRVAREFLTEKGAEAGRRLPPCCVLVTCIGATIGKVGFAEVACATNQQVNAAIPSDGVHARWMYRAMTAPQFQIQITENASATTLPIINKGRFEQLFVAVPPASEQRELDGAVNRMLNPLAPVAEGVGLNRVSEVERSLLAKAFRGELTT